MGWCALKGCASPLAIKGALVTSSGIASSGTFCGTGKSENEKAEQILQASCEECCWDLVLEAMPMNAQESEVSPFFFCGWQMLSL